MRSVLPPLGPYAIAALRAGDGEVVIRTGTPPALEALVGRDEAKVTGLDDAPLPDDALPFAAAVAGQPYAARPLRVWRNAVPTDVVARVLKTDRDDLSFLVVEPHRDTPVGLERFVTIATHELRSPIASLELDLERMRRRLTREGRLGGEVTPSLARALRQVARLRLVVQNLVDATRMQARAFALAGGPEPIDLAAFVRSRVEALRPVAAASRCTIACEARAEIVGAWDSLRVEQVLHNLVTNALKHAGEGKTIHVRVDRRGGRALLTVRDEGPGVSPEERQRIFEPFARGARASDAVASHSLGLGLYIVREIATAHGGSVHIHDPEPGGASFVVELPIPSPPCPRDA